MNQIANVLDQLIFKPINAIWQPYPCNAGAKKIRYFLDSGLCLFFVGSLPISLQTKLLNLARDGIAANT